MRNARMPAEALPAAGISPARHYAGTQQAASGAAAWRKAAGAIQHQRHAQGKQAQGEKAASGRAIHGAAGAVNKIAVHMQHKQHAIQRLHLLNAHGATDTAAKQHAITWDLQIQQTALIILITCPANGTIQ